MSLSRRCQGLLFDLDGTVLDTAPDLLAALNALRGRRGLAGVPLAGFREQVSRGARAMLGHGLPGFAGADEASRQPDVDEFLAIYLADICSRTELFDGMRQTLDALAARALPLAIVTNKAIGLARRVLDQLDLADRFGSVIGGDSLAERKPHPLPVLTACAQVGVDPARALMIGDDARDIQAGRAAGCTTVAVTWGYAGAAEIATWDADHVIDRPGQLMDLL